MKVDTLMRSKLNVFIIVIIYFILNNYLYLNVSTQYNYLFQFKSNFDLNRCILSICYLIPVSIFLKKLLAENNLYDLLLTLLIIMYFIPGATMYLYGNFSNLYFSFYIICFINLFFVDSVIPHRKMNLNYVSTIKGNESKDLKVKIFAISLSLVIITIVAIFNRINITFNIEDVYTLRSEWKETNMPNIFNYLIPFAARLTPILVAIFLYKKNYLIVLLLIFSQLTSFGFGGMKYTLFALIVVVLIYKLPDIKHISSIVYLFLFLHLISVLEELVFSTSFFSTFIQRRISFIPNQIGYYYFEFFSNTDLLLFKESFLRLFDFISPYDKPVPHVIATYAFNAPNMGANTGLFAEGFSQIGWYAFIIYPILYIITFRFFEYSFLYFEESEISKKIIVASSILYAMSFIDGAFFSILLTQGFLLFCISMRFISKNVLLKK